MVCHTSLSSIATGEIVYTLIHPQCLAQEQGLIPTGWMGQRQMLPRLLLLRRIPSLPAFLLHGYYSSVVCSRRFLCLLLKVKFVSFLSSRHFLCSLLHSHSGSFLRCRSFLCSSNISTLSAFCASAASCSLFHNTPSAVSSATAASASLASRSSSASFVGLGMHDSLFRWFGFGVRLKIAF